MAEWARALDPIEQRRIEVAGELKVYSNTFEEGGKIPRRCAYPWVGGENVSPQLAWEGVPEGTRSLAVTCWDPDAPTTVGFSHWLLFNLSPDTSELPEGAGAPGANPPGSVLGFTDYGESAYGGMAPPREDPPHHYIFTVYALDLDRLEADEKTTYAKLRFLIRGHVLAEGRISGLFSSAE